MKIIKQTGQIRNKLNKQDKLEYAFIQIQSSTFG